MVGEVLSSGPVLARQASAEEGREEQGRQAGAKDPTRLGTSPAAREDPETVRGFEQRAIPSQR